jgi:glutamine amidotransferase
VPADVAIIDGGGANIASLRFALERLTISSVLTTDHDVIRSAPRVILPGVGAAEDAMQKLRKAGLDSVIPTLTQPLLGICLGMQLLFASSEEDDAELLGLIPARLTRLHEQPKLRVPHMGWNVLKSIRKDKLTDSLDGLWFYFVHSYAAPVGAWTLSTSSHGEQLSAIVRCNNFYGAQFHPERSAQSGACC